MRVRGNVMTTYACLWYHCD